MGGTNTVTGLVDGDGHVCGRREFKTGDYPLLDDYVARLVQDIVSLSGDCDVAGIGMGVPNGNYLSGRAENPVNIDWYERGSDNSCGERILSVPLAEAVKERFRQVPVVLDNDANVAAIGEMIYGGARGMSDFIEITLGTGFGSGVVAGGKVVYGYGGTAGELGHVVVRRGGRLCGCGRRGCLETYVSATGMVRTMLEIMADDLRPSPLRHVAADRLDAETIADAARGGDELALRAFEHTGMILGQALADFVAFSFPEAIFLSGGLARSGELLLAPARRHMESNLMRGYKGRVRLLPSGVDGGNAALLGASALVWRELRG